ncbi:hypothetical protein KKG24_02415 [Patescibacteria group bacterium]|nr:hypothetical protein [Patescibacteria group bacterium]
MKRDVLNSPRLLELKRHRRRIILIKFFIFILGLIVFCILLLYLSNLDVLNISKVEILNKNTTDMEAIKKMAEEQIAGKYLGLFPKTNIFFYPKNAIKSKLQEKFKKLKNINLSIKNNKILEISSEERIAKYTWCGVVRPASYTNDQKCYFMDEDGYIFDEAPYFSGEVYFKFYGIQSESYFFKQNFKQLIIFKDILLKLGLKPVSLDITDIGDVEIFLMKGTSSALAPEPKIIFKIDADFQNIIENLETALNTEPLKSKFKNKYSSFLYIDLRFENKVYDKFQ